MNKTLHPGPQILGISIISLTWMAATLAPAISCFASQPTIWKIEEDWEMIVIEPQPTSNAPQVTFYTSPSTETDSTYFQLQMNYAADVGYSAGGFHVAAVRGESILDEARSKDQSVLSISGDAIHWTSVMALVNHKLLFAVKDGYSSQWGNFGGPEYLVEMPSLSIHDLDGYSPDQSLDTVDVGFGGNRISSVTLRRVRVFYSNGQVSTLELNSVAN